MTRNPGIQNTEYGIRSTLKVPNLIPTSSWILAPNYHERRKGCWGCKCECDSEKGCRCDSGCRCGSRYRSSQYKNIYISVRTKEYTSSQIVGGTGSGWSRPTPEQTGTTHPVTPLLARTWSSTPLGLRRVITATAYEILARRWNLNKVEKVTVINCSNANLWDNKKIDSHTQMGRLSRCPESYWYHFSSSQRILFFIFGWSLNFEGRWQTWMQAIMDSDFLISKWYNFKSIRQNKLQLIIIEYFVASACKNVRCRSFFFCKKCDAPNQKGTSKNNLSAVPDWFLRPCR